MSEGHQGKKYIRRIFSVDGTSSIEVDIYCVLEAFAVTCPARQHAGKKLLCCGNRGKGDEFDDLRGARDAIQRAIVMAKARKLIDRLDEMTAPPNETRRDKEDQ